MAEAVARLAETGEYRVPLTVCAGLMVTGWASKAPCSPSTCGCPTPRRATTASSALLSGLVLKGYIVLMMTLMVRVFPWSSWWSWV
jgi:multicomponent Na+:H+ antiporter subunit D